MKNADVTRIHHTCSVNLPLGPRGTIWGPIFTDAAQTSTDATQMVCSVAICSSDQLSALKRSLRPAAFPMLLARLP